VNVCQNLKTGTLLPSKTPHLEARIENRYISEHLPSKVHNVLLRHTITSIHNSSHAWNERVTAIHKHIGHNLIIQLCSEKVFSTQITWRGRPTRVLFYEWLPYYQYL